MMMRGTKLMSLIKKTTTTFKLKVSQWSWNGPCLRWWLTREVHGLADEAVLYGSDDDGASVVSRGREGAARDAVLSVLHTDRVVTWWARQVGGGVVGGGGGGGGKLEWWRIHVGKGGEDTIVCDLGVDWLIDWLVVEWQNVSFFGFLTFSSITRLYRG